MMNTERDVNASIPGFHERARVAILRHMKPVGILTFCIVVAFIALVGRHPTLAVVLITPLVMFGVVLLIVSVPAVRNLESMGNEATQEYVLETSRDVSGMSRREKRTEVRAWKHRLRHPRALRLFGIMIVAVGFILLLVAEQWTGAIIVGAAVFLLVIPARRTKR